MTGWRKLIDPDPPPPKELHTWGLIGFRNAVELGFAIALGMGLLGFIVGVLWGVLHLIGSSF